MINNSLQRHSGVIMHGEVFGDDKYLGLVGVDYKVESPLDDVLRKWRDDDAVGFLHDVIFNAGSRAAVGLKLKYEEFLLPKWKRLQEEIAADRTIHIVHLYRENLLERYVSQYKAVHVTGVYNVQGERALPEDPSVELDPVACEADFRAATHRRQYFSRLFAEHPTYEISYEELIGDIQGTYRSLQEFLAVEVEELPITTKRLQRRNVRESVRNFEELRSYFAGTEFEEFFSERRQAY